MFRNSSIKRALIVMTAIVCIAIFLQNCKTDSKKKTASTTGLATKRPQWVVPDTNELANIKDGQLIKYGRSLIINTSYYLGPKGVIAHKSNGINCQSCHLNAGTKFLGN